MGNYTREVGGLHADGVALPAGRQVHARHDAAEIGLIIGAMRPAAKQAQAWYRFRTGLSCNYVW